MATNHARPDGRCTLLAARCSICCLLCPKLMADSHLSKLGACRFQTLFFFRSSCLLFKALCLLLLSYCSSSSSSSSSVSDFDGAPSASNLPPRARTNNVSKPKGFRGKANLHLKLPVSDPFQLRELCLPNVVVHTQCMEMTGRGGVVN